MIPGNLPIGLQLILLDKYHMPIDPFPSEPNISGDRKTFSNKHNGDPGSLHDPSRQVLKTLPNIAINGLPSSTSAHTGVKEKVSKGSKPVKVLSGEELECFKREVDGSDLPKVGLLAVLKKRYVPNAITV